MYIKILIFEHVSLSTQYRVCILMHFIINIQNCPMSPAIHLSALLSKEIVVVVVVVVVVVFWGGVKEVRLKFPIVERIILLLETGCPEYYYYVTGDFLQGNLKMLKGFPHCSLILHPSDHFCNYKQCQCCPAKR